MGDGDDEPDPKSAGEEPDRQSARTGVAGGLVSLIGLLIALFTAAAGDGALFLSAFVDVLPSWSVVVFVGCVGLAGSIWVFRRARTAGERLSQARINAVRFEVELQAAAADKIKAEAEQNQRLAELNAEQAQAVKNLVESVQTRASRSGGRQQWLFFLAGLLAAIPTGVAGNSCSSS